eukprot:04164.XXX_153890_152127_1 [CDS] Oithona nana genome sequencing.
MVRGPKTRPVPKPKVMPEDGETLKAAINGKLHKGQTDLLSANPRKRGRAPAAVAEAVRAEKRAKLEARLVLRKEHFKNINGVVLTLGQGDTGQLGLGPDIMERSKPGLVKDLANVVAVCAGGMHTVCLAKDGRVYTFGCNDEGALGRIMDDEEEESSVPGLVDLPASAAQISAGDSHTAALTDDGRVFYWGTFRDSSGSFGLTPDGQMQKLPVHLSLPGDRKVVKISSGTDHLAMLTSAGELYTVGCGEQGQLGRVAERFVARGGRRGLELLLLPDRVHAKNRRTVFADVWAGSYDTLALSTDNEVLVCGLNNYNQLGVPKGKVLFTLTKSKALTEAAASCGGWAQIVPGQHHTLALDAAGRVHALGRVDYGRLGLGQQRETDATEPIQVLGPLEGQKCVDVSCGTTVSFAITEGGECFSWGMGSNGQLGHSDEEDAWEPEKMLGKQLEQRKVMAVSGGGQHTVLIAQPGDSAPAVSTSQS